ncbi:Firmicu-CTERM sorting domain-containing protein [Clostridium ljungdahlii]|uniref:Firmicu-CTERM sorting domain-containing protein n=1 Tax=Clostridium ljungdahlii TaxID=1538 RepID=UPI003863A0F9
MKWYSDDKDLYLYIKMATVGGQQLNNYTITYSDNNGIQGNLTIQVDRPSKGRISIYNYSMDYRPFSTDGYVVRGSNSDGKTSDQGEFRIPLTIFQKDSKDQMITLNLGFPNLGNQGVAFQVGSTYPYMGVSIGILIVASGFFIYRRKRKIE